MSLEYWDVREGERDGVEIGDLKLKCDDAQGRVLTLEKRQDGKIIFREGCAELFTATMINEDAKKALLEAIAWIDKD